ncbi:MAG: heme ABC transporter permease [Steroidobacteraceae bacterium]
MNWTWFHRLASPPHVFRVAGSLTPWFAGGAALLIAYGLYGGLWAAPADYQQGDGFRIIYVHAPSAWISVFVYSTLGISAGIGLIWRMKIAHALAASCATVGAWFTVVALVTGMLWGKPMWGTYWVWDPRLTAELVLLFLYLGYMALRAARDDIAWSDRASAVLAVVGLVNVPIIRYSVEWWNSIHQAPSVMKMARPSMPAEMLWPLLAMFFGFTLLCAALLAMRLRAEIIRRERNASWVAEVLKA